MYTISGLCSFVSPNPDNETASSCWLHARQALAVDLHPQRIPTPQVPGSGHDESVASKNRRLEQLLHAAAFYENALPCPSPIAFCPALAP